MPEKKVSPLDELRKVNLPTPAGKLIVLAPENEDERQADIERRKKQAQLRKNKFKKLGKVDVGGGRNNAFKPGRPTLMTKDTLAKLEQAFMLGCSDTEACLYADVSPSTLYHFQNAHPEFVQRKQALKEFPVLKARQTVVGDLNAPETAKWLLERKRKDEFSTKTETETTGTITLAVDKQDKEA